MSLVVCTWWWGDKFGADDVSKLAAGVARNLRQPHRFVVITDRNPRDMQGEAWPIPARDIPLTQMRGCFARLRMFDVEWQAANGIENRLACIDLDTVITGPLDPVFDRPESFVIMQKGNAANPCPYNGALMMLRPGAHSEVWNDFDLETELTWCREGPSPIDRPTYYEFADDQGWIAHKVPGAAGWKCGVDSGVFVFRKPGWPSFDRKMKHGGDDLPKGARLVTFSGGRSPEKFRHLDWVKNNWIT